MINCFKLEQITRVWVEKFSEEKDKSRQSQERRNTELEENPTI